MLKQEEENLKLYEYYPFASLLSKFSNFELSLATYHPIYVV